VTTDPGSLQGALFDQDEGPDGIVLAGWGFAAVLAFIFAYGAWQFGVTEPPPTETALPSAGGNVEITGSINGGSAASEVGMFGDRDRQAGALPAEVTTIEVDVLRREMTELRRTVLTMREVNDRLHGRIAKLERDMGGITGSIGTGRPAIRPLGPQPMPAFPPPEVTVSTRPLDPATDAPDIDLTEPTGVNESVGKADRVALTPSGEASKGSETPATPIVTTSIPVRDVAPAKVPEATRQPVRVVVPATPAPTAPNQALVADGGNAEAVDETLVTGSIPISAPRVILPRPKPPRDVAAAPAEPAPVSQVALAPPETTATTPAEPGVPATQTTATESPELSKSLFGIDLGGYASLGTLRDGWAEFALKNPEASKGLKPLTGMSERDGKLEARLIAGPFTNVADAVKVCAGLMAKGSPCQPTLFAGQPLTSP